MVSYTAAAKAQFEQGPDMQAFRSLLFSKVVPNLRKLGLLTPRVREGFEQLGILKYERYIDSATEACTGSLSRSPRGRPVTSCGRSSAAIRSVRARTTSRSVRFFNSRTLPGQS